MGICLASLKRFGAVMRAAAMVARISTGEIAESEVAAVDDRRDRHTDALGWCLPPPQAIEEQKDFQVFR